MPRHAEYRAHDIQETIRYSPDDVDALAAFYDNLARITDYLESTFEIHTW